MDLLVKTQIHFNQPLAKVLLSSVEDIEESVLIVFTLPKLGESLCSWRKSSIWKQEERLSRGEVEPPSQYSDQLCDGHVVRYQEFCLKFNFISVSGFWAYFVENRQRLFWGRAFYNYRHFVGVLISDSSRISSTVFKGLSVFEFASHVCLMFFIPLLKMILWDQSRLKLNLVLWRKSEREKKQWIV